MNLFLLIVGCVMDSTPAILILAPILQPIAASYGIDGIWFGLMMVLNLATGFLTPPVGLNLFVTCSLWDVKLPQLVKKLVPFLITMFICLMLVTYCKYISVGIPMIFGYKPL